MDVCWLFNTYYFRIHYFSIQSQRHLPSWLCQIVNYRSKNLDFFNLLVIHLILFVYERSSKKSFFSIDKNNLHFFCWVLKKWKFSFQCLWDEIKTCLVFSSLFVFYVKINLTLCEIRLILHVLPHYSIVRRSNNYHGSYY